MDMLEVCVVIPFVRVDASQNPNLTVKRGDNPADAYFRSMIVAFASVRRFNPLIDLVLVTNEEAPDPYKEQLLDLGVQTELRSFDHVPPKGYSARFSASLYLIDALESLRHRTTIIIDPDVLCIRSLEGMLSAMSEEVGVLPIDYSANHNVNGISRVQAAELHGLLGEPDGVPAHFGGEVYILPYELLDVVRQRCGSAWEFSLERNRQGLTKFFTEEHILNYALRGVPTIEITPYVRRIWTAHRLRQVYGTEHLLTLWHLPAEKDRGFAAIYPSVIQPQSWFWAAQDSEFIALAGRAMGLHHRSPKRILLDAAGQMLHKLRSQKLSRP